MKKKHQFVLVLGIINVILPVIPILAHRGLFGMVENGWKFIWVAAIIPSLTVEKQKNGCKASKINACSRFLFRNDMCYCAIFFTLW